jgi:hypothetical protein
VRRQRLVALAATIALLVSTAVFAAHGLAERGHEHTHCDLCVHFSGTAGSASTAKVIGKPVLVVRALPVRPEVILPVRSPVGAHLPRGPPLPQLAPV